MKFLVPLCFLFVSLTVDARPTQEISKDMPDVLLDTINDSIVCSRQIGPEAEALSESQTGGILPEDNDTFNVYFGCIWKRKGIVNDRGEVNRNNLKSYLLALFTMGEGITAQHNLLADDVLDHCENVHGNDHGLTAVKIHNCVMNRLYAIVGDED